MESRLIKNYFNTIESLIKSLAVEMGIAKEGGHATRCVPPTAAARPRIRFQTVAAT